MRLIITGLLLLVVNFTYAQIPTYYNDVDVTLTGTALKNALTTKITTTHTNFLSYTPGVWEASMVTDLDPSNSSNVLLIYGYNDSDANYVTDRSRSKTANGGNAGTDWNREHTYPKSLGNPNLGTSGPGADAHHLRPSDVTMNSNRGSLKFIDGSGNAGATGSGWYPGDEWKGDVARMMLYMYLRYGTRCLPSNVAIGNANSVDSNMIDLLLEWNAEDPVSDFERQRNTYHENTANTYAQGNRNPFIDNPVFATSIWGGPAAEDFFSSSVASCSDLFISEYIEGTSNNKYIELYNPTNASINLSSYDLVIYSNGSSSITSTLTLSGSISAYGTFVIENSSEALGVTADLSTSNAVMTFNGDDAIALRKSSTAIDIIGQIGSDPGTEWAGSVCTQGTADGVLRRNVTINKGDSEGSDTFDPDSEWTCAATDDVSNLGSYTNNCVPNPEIDVQGNGSSIPDGTTTTQLSNFTDFGSVAASSGTIIKTFTIANTGTSTLTVSSNPSISGTGASDFTVSTNPSLSISASSSTTFQITFDPSAEATSTATVTINSDDADEAVYTFNITGTGIAGGGGGNCGSETFTNSNAPSGSYGDGNFTGDNSVTWTYVGSRDDEGYEITGTGLMLRNTSSKVTSSTVSGGIGSFTVSLKKAFTGSGNRQVELFVNSVSRGTSVAFDNTTTQTFTVNDINVSGDVIIEIRNITSKQVILDDISWTCYSGGGGSSSGCDDLFISEYIEGTGNNKYIELYNASSSPIDLSSYDLVSYTNGSSSISNTLTLSGTIAAHSTFVIENSSEALGVTADLSTSNGVMQFNGDDAIALRKSSVAIDVIGQIGTDPGSQWSGTTCTLGTADAVLRRNSTVNSGDSDGSNAFDPDTEWTCSAAGDVSDLGSYTNDCSSSSSGPCQDLFISEYVEGTGNNKFIEIYNPSDASIDLTSYDLVRYSNGSATITNTLTLSGSIAPKGTYVIENSSETLIVSANLSTTNGVMTFNGDDAIALRKSSTVIDVIGQIGTDPGTEWAGSTCTQGTADGTLRRNATVDQGDSDGSNTFDPDTEWTCAATDDVSNLGSYTNNCDSASGTPEIDVISNSISIIDGTTSTSTTNNTNYGSVNVTTGSIVKEYSITNNGTGILTLTGNPTITGSSDFSITTNPSGLTVNPTESVTFQITFDPSTNGNITGTVEILSDDSDEASFTFAISGTGTSSASSCSTVNGATLYQQDFESSPASPEYTYTSSSTSTSTGNGNTPSDPKYVSGSQGIQVNNGTGEIIFSTVDVSGSSNVEFSVRLASFSGTSGNGAETADYVKVFVSTDGGSNYSEELTVTGASANNARWSFTSGTGEASTAYDGDNTTTTFAPSGGGARTTDGYSTLKVTGLPSSSTLRIKLEVKNNSSNELWVLDDATLIGDSVSSSTWESGSWSNGVPSTTAKIIINGYYDMTANTSINTCECEIMPGGTLTIGIDKYLRIENNIINNGTIIVEENGALVQVSSSGTITGSGTYIVRRNSSSVVSENVFTYWSSPLVSSTLNEVVSNANRYYTFDAPTQGWLNATSSTTMTPGVGYITQGPVDGIYPGTYTAVYTGSKFNNGDINVTLGYTADADTDNDWNLLGNPYPSAIDANAFIAANSNIGGTVYFWSNNTDASTSQNFSQDDYVSWNGTGGTAGCSGCIAPTGAIAAGQGFFVQALSATDVTFTNAIRDNGNNDNFYRNGNEEDKIWLNFFGTNAFSQILVGFIDKATDGEDRLYDGRRLDGGANATFYSLIDDISFGIQGKSSLKEVEEIPLGVQLNVTGDFNISIEKFEGLLEDSEVYIKDLVLDIEHNLKDSDYQVTLSETGKIDDRFILKIVTSADVLGIDDLEDNSDLIIVDHGNQLEVKTSDNKIVKEVFMYDILGRNLFTKRKSTDTSVFVRGNVINKNTITLVKVVLESGKVETMKFLRK